MSDNRRRARRALASAFSALRLDVGASERDVKAAYKTLARAHHPDKPGGDVEAFRAIQRAYETITTKFERERAALAAMGTAAFGSGTRGDETRERDARRRDEVEVEVALEIRQGEDGASITMGGDLKAIGDARYEAGEYEKAIECYTAAAAYAKVDGTAEYAELYHARGMAYAKLDRWREACDDADRAIGVRALWFPPWILKGRALEALGAWSRAAELYRECVDRATSSDDDEEFSSVLIEGLARVEAKMLREDRVASIQAHRGPVIGLAMKPSSTNVERGDAETTNAYVATIGEDNNLKLFSVPQGECLYSTKLPHAVSELKWSPEGDGELVVAGVNGFVSIWTFNLTERGAPSASVASTNALVGFSQSVNVTAIDFDRTGEFVAAGASDGSICVWDVAHATLELVIPAGLNAHKREITCLAFHPTRGRAQLTSGSRDGDGRVWDLVAEATETAGECLHTLRWKSGAIIDVNYLSCGRLIVTSTAMSALKGASRSLNRLLVWSSVSGRLCKWYDAHSSRISSFSWHPHPGSRNVAVTGCDDGVLRVWSIRASPSGAGKPLLENSDHSGVIATMRGVDVVRSGAVVKVAHSPMGGLVAVVTRDGFLRVHDSDTLEATSSWRASGDGAVTHVAWSPTPISLRSGERLTAASPWMVVIGDEGGRVSVWRVARSTHDDSDDDEDDEVEQTEHNEVDVDQTANRSLGGVYTSRDVKTWWDEKENTSEVAPSWTGVHGTYLGASAGDKPIYKALTLGEAPGQVYDPSRRSATYVDLSLRDGETASSEAYDAIETKISELQSARAEYMRDDSTSSEDKRAYSARFAAEMEPLRAARARVYAALRARGEFS